MPIKDLRKRNIGSGDLLHSVPEGAVPQSAPGAALKAKPIQNVPAASGIKRDVPIRLSPEIIVELDRARKTGAKHESRASFVRVATDTGITGKIESDRLSRLYQKFQTSMTEAAGAFGLVSVSMPIEMYNRVVASANERDMPVSHYMGVCLLHLLDMN